MRRFDLAVVHPAVEDCPFILGELYVRREFRVLYTKFDREPEMDGRLIYTDQPLVFERLKFWVETGKLL